MKKIVLYLLLFAVALVCVFKAPAQNLTFTTTLIPTGGFPQGVGITDINGDGMLDCYVDHGSVFDPLNDFSFQRYINNGNSTYRKESYSFYATPQANSVTHDGVFCVLNNKPVFVLNQYTDIGILYQDVSGGDSIVYYHVGYTTEELAIRDLNADGHTDIATRLWSPAGQQKRIAVLFGTGTGFTTIVFPVSANKNVRIANGLLYAMNDTGVNEYAFNASNNISLQNTYPLPINAIAKCFAVANGTLMIASRDQVTFAGALHTFTIGQVTGVASSLQVIPSAMVAGPINGELVWGLLSNNNLELIVNGVHTMYPYPNGTSQTNGIHPNGIAISGKVVFSLMDLNSNNRALVIMEPTQTTGIANTNTEENNVILFPNPTTDFITVKGLNEKEILYIVDLSGREVRVKKNENTFDVSQLARGIYYLCNKTETLKLKFLKQ